MRSRLGFSFALPLVFYSRHLFRQHMTQKRTRLTSCPFLWTSRPVGPRRPSGLKCSEWQSHSCAEVLPAAKRSYAAPAPPALQAGLEILSLRVYFMAHATSNWLGPFLPRCASPPAASSIRAAAQTKWSCLICSIRWMTGTPKGHLFSQLPQAMQSSAFAWSAW